MRALVFTLVLLACSGALAQQDRFSRGLEAYQRGDYQGAATEWNAAYAADPRPGLLFNIARAYLRMGRLTDAKETFERYLATSPSDAESIAETRANLAAIRERLAHTGVRIRCEEEGAVILIDGVEWGRTPRPDAISVEPGVRRVVVRARDGREFEASVGVREGAVENVEAVLMAPTRALAEPAEPAAASAPPAEPATAPTAPPSTEQASSSFRVPAASIALYAVGGASIVTGVVLGALAGVEADDAATSDGAQADKARALGVGADVALFGGIAIAATGAVLMFVLPPAERDSATSFVPVVAPGFAGAALTVSF